MAKDFTDIFVIALIFLALIVVVAGLVSTATSRVDVANETISGLSNVTPDTLANDRLLDGSVLLINDTGNNTIPTSNYTINLNAGTILMNSPSIFVGEDGLITYTVRADVEGASAIVVGLIVIVLSVVFIRTRTKEMKGGTR